MELGEAIRRRRMTRSFSPEPLPAALLESVLGVATRAPSAGHTQGVDLLVLQEEAVRQRFWEATSDEDFRRSSQLAGGLLPAPVIVLPLASPATYHDRYTRPDKAMADDPASWTTPYWLVDAAFATMLVLLAATEQGLGALFFRLHVDPRSFLDDLGVPEDRIAIGALALGWRSAGERPIGSAARLGRRGIGDVLHWDGW